LQKFIKVIILFYLVGSLGYGVSHAWEIKAISASTGADPYALINKATILQSEQNHFFEMGYSFGDTVWPSTITKKMGMIVPKS